MTIIEAISQLCDLRDSIINFDMIEGKEDDIKAIDKAIKILQETALKDLNSVLIDHFKSLMIREMEGQL